MTARHHYIPQFLIRNFCYSEEKIYYIHKIISKEVRYKSPKQIFYETNLNTIINNDRSEDTKTLEDTASGLETKYAPIIRKIIDNSNKYTRITLSDNEVNALNNFLIHQYLRVPSFNKNSKTLQQKMSLDVIFEEIRKNNYSIPSYGNIPLEEREELEKNFLIWEHNTKKTAVHIQSSSLLKYLNDFGFCVLKITKNKHFLLGDTPVIRMQKSANNKYLDGFIMPISPTLALGNYYTYTPKNNLIYKEIESESIKIINNLITNQSECLASNSKPLLQKILKNNSLTPKPLQKRQPEGSLHK